MLWGDISSFVLAALMLVLVGFGLAYARSAAPEKQMLVLNPTPVPVA